MDILEYDDEAEAEMPEDDLPVRITRIRLKPRIVVSPNTNEARIRQLVGSRTTMLHREQFEVPGFGRADH
jgi:hypothetical protein